MDGPETLRARYWRRFRWGAALWCLLLVPAVIHSHAAIGNLLNRPHEWVPDSLPARQAFTTFSELFRATDLVMVAWDGSDLDDESLQRVASLLGLLSRSPGEELAEFGVVDRAEPAAPFAERVAAMRRLLRSSDLPPERRAEVLALAERLWSVDSGPPLRWARSGTESLRRMTSAPTSLPRAVAIRRLQGTMVGPDGEQTCVVLSMTDRAMRNRRQVLPPIRGLVAAATSQPAEQVAMVGAPVDGAAVDAASIRSVRLFTPPSGIVAAILCFLCLRSLPLTVVITAVALLGEGVVLALVHYSGTPMNAVLILLPPLVFVLTVSSGIHLSNYFLDAAEEFADLTPPEAVRRALRAGVAPCLLASGTTVIGLGSLMLVRLEPIQVFGAVASVGVLTTLGLLLLLLPGAMLLTPLSPRRLGRGHGQWRLLTLAGSIMRRSLRRPWPLIATFLLIAAGFAAGLPQLETTVNVLRMFRPDSRLRRDYAWFEREVAPTVTGEILLRFDRDEDVDELDRLDLVRRVHLAMLEQEDVGGALSPVSFVPPVPRGRSLSAAARRNVIRSLIRDPESSLGKLGFIARTEEEEIWRVSLRVSQQADIDFGKELDAIREKAAAVVREGSVAADVQLTGSVAIVQRAQEVLLRDLFRSFLSAFGIVAVVMMALLRSLHGGALAMIPNLFPTITLFGLMGVLREPLDIGSVMTASVALGIAVDDTVHLLSRFGSMRGRGIDRVTASFGALRQCGKAMSETTIVCGLSLMVYWFSDFVPTSRFALLMLGLLSAALIGDVFLLPAMMSSRLGRWLARPVGADPGAQLDHEATPDQTPPDVRRLGRSRELDAAGTRQPETIGRE